MFDGKWFRQTECRRKAQILKAWVPKGRFRDIVKSDWLWLFWQMWRFVDRVPFLADIGGNTVPEGLRDTTASKSHARQEQYTIDYPPLDYPDSKIIPRETRNSSPTREKDVSRLNAWARYHRLNTSLEPLQTSYGKTDGEKYADGEGEDDVAVPRLDAELENRPSVEELVARYNVRGVRYETLRIGGTEDGPPFMKFPVSGDVEGSVTYTVQNRKGKRERQTLVNIGNRKKGVSWTLYRIGGLRFAPKRTKYRGQVVYQGALTHYVDSKNPNRWHRVKEDVAGTPRGPEFLGSANKKDADDMCRNGWEGFLSTPMRETTMQWLSDKEKSEQWSNEFFVPSKDVPLPCRTLYHLRKRGPPRMLLRYDIACDTPSPVYAFGSTYTLPEEPADDVVERKSELDAVNAMLSPQGLRVTNALVLKDRNKPTRKLAELGAMFWTDCRKRSVKSLERDGKLLADDTADELILIFQILDAV